MTVYPNYQLPCGKVLPALPSRVASVYAWLERWHRQNGRLVFCTGYLAGKMEVSERTAYSWLEKMRSAGYIHCDRVGRERHITPLARPFFLRGRASGISQGCFSDSAPIPPIVSTQDAFTHNAQQTDTTDTTASEASPVVVSKEEERETAKETNETSNVTQTGHSCPIAPIVAEVAALASIPATEAARAVKIDPARAKNAAGVVKATKQPENPLSLFWASFHRGWVAQFPAKNGTPASLGQKGGMDANSEEWDKARARHLGAIPETEYPQLRTRAERYLRETKGLRYFSLDTLAQMMAKAWENQMRGTVRA